MALPKDAYKMFEEVVGSEDVTERMEILSAYYVGMLNLDMLPKQMVDNMLPTMGLTEIPRPEAVILPESTEEVQAIVRICNKYKITYNVIGSAFNPFGYFVKLAIDPRKMNKILGLGIGCLVALAISVAPNIMPTADACGCCSCCCACCACIAVCIAGTISCMSIPCSCCIGIFGLIDWIVGCSNCIVSGLKV